MHANVNGRNIYFWIVPAKVDGKWQVEGEQKMTLDIDQKYQFFTGKADIGGKTIDINDGQLKGAEISFKVDGQTYTGKVYGNTIAGGNWKARRPKVFPPPVTRQTKALPARSVLLQLRRAQDILMTSKFRRPARQPVRDRRRADDGRHHHRHRHFQDRRRSWRSMSERRLVHRGLGAGRRHDPDRRAGLCRTGRGLSVHRRRISFSDPRLRPVRRFPVRMGAHHRDPDRRDCGDRFVLGDYAQQIYSLGKFGSAIYGAAALFILTLVNLAGTYQSKTAQNF